jgi:hypothetical protein
VRKLRFGKVVYVGSAKSTWCWLTDCQLDRNVIDGQRYCGTTPRLWTSRRAPVAAAF